MISEKPMSAYRETVSAILNLLKIKEPRKISFIGGGYYGRVFRVKPKSGETVIVKLYLVDELCDKEASQIEELSKYSLLKMPKVFLAIHKKNEIAFDAIVMEELQGRPVGIPFRATRATKEKMGNAIAENLVALHSVKGTTFGEIGGEQFRSARDYYRQTVDNAILKFQDFCKRHIGYNEILNDIIAISKDFDELIKGDIEPTLIHGDYNTFNILRKGKVITGVIDPCGGAYGDRLCDLYQLNNFNGKNLQLFEKYRSIVKLPSNAEKTMCFYEIFSELKHYLAIDRINDKKFFNAIERYKSF